MPGHDWKIDVLLPGNWRGASSVLLRGRDGPVIVDTGMPHDAHQLVSALAAHGLRPEDVRIVVNTHFHLDHVSNNCLFPSSVIYASQESFDWCRSLYATMLSGTGLDGRVLAYYPEVCEYDNAEYLFGKIRKIALRWWDVKRAGAAGQFRWIEQHDLPPGIETVMTEGHVPGHASLIVRNGGGSHTVIAADALVTREHDEQVLTMIPHNRLQYLRDRATILSLGGIIIPGHDDPFSIPGNSNG